jgi:hypothetical protein
MKVISLQNIWVISNLKKEKEKILCIILRFMKKPNQILETSSTLRAHHVKRQLFQKFLHVAGGCLAYFGLL